MKSVTALFTFPYSDGVEIKHFDFGRPVLDFIVGDDGVIVVSLDGEPMVRTVKMTLGGVGISLCGMIRNLFFCSLSKHLMRTRC